MGINLKVFIAGALLIFGMPLAANAITTGEAAPDFSLVDTHGQAHQLSQYKGQVVVLEWMNPDCPFVKKHYGSQNMQNLQKQFTGQGVIWLSINSSAEGKQGYYSPQEFNQIIQNTSALPTAFLLDSNGEVGKLYGAQTTPHMFIINADGALVYQGAIDSVATPDPADIAGAQNYVQSALDEVLAGKPVSVSSTKSYGCSVKY